jgi:hypothetical protein
MIQRIPQAIEFWPLQSLYENLGVHQDSISQSGNCLGSVNVHSLTLSYTPGSMRCDFQGNALNGLVQIGKITKKGVIYKLITTHKTI